MVTRAILAKSIKNGGMKSLNRYGSKISQWIQKLFAPSEPDFFAISKMVHYLSVPQKLPKLAFQVAHFA